MKSMLLNSHAVKAESLLAVTFGEQEKVEVIPVGVFSRNYNDDLISIDKHPKGDKGYIAQLSRDSVFHTLPEGLFFKENRLRKLDKVKCKEESEAIQREKENLLLFFQPFDQVYFELRLRLEREMNALLADKSKTIANTLFDIYKIDRANEYICKTIPMLPLASAIRGNRILIQEILTQVFAPLRIAVRITDPQVFRVVIFKPGLSHTAFAQMQEQVSLFGEFFHEWFLPVTLAHAFKVKDPAQPFRLGQALTLDYNTFIQ